ncbi:GH3 auxin-responsive promoter family protein [Candidatus Bathyarchaeota archaeon]|nr:GH3 auxin-responsive promoter family protein [Candidatus Bathyarchaeota archaeon]
MAQLVMRAAKPLIKKFALDFLKERNVSAKEDTLIRKKIKRVARSGLGKKLGVEQNTRIEKIPFTGYDYYLPFFRNPHENDFIYPLNDYVRSQTSGTMSKPKIYLLPKTGFKENLKRSAISLFFICTHDGTRPLLEVGDTVYANLPGGAFIGSQITTDLRSSQSAFINLVPKDSNMPFKEKVDYFIKNHEEIDIAYMTVTTFLDEICPQVDDEIYLKGFLTQDISAGPLKEIMREKSGHYPKTVFGSTETFLSGLPSVEHPGSFFFDWRVVYHEFLPEDQTVDPNVVTVTEPPETVGMMDVEPGKRYQLIVTPIYNDLTRYIMPDIFECVSKGDNLLNSNVPVFKYYSRADRLLVLHNFTRINEEELVSVLHDAKIPFIDFTARRELHESREFLSLYIELSETMSEDEVLDRVNKRLLEFDKDWRDLSDFMNYTPMKVTFLPKDTFKKYLHRKEGMARIQRIGMREERFNELLNHT